MPSMHLASTCLFPIKSLNGPCRKLVMNSLVIAKKHKAQRTYMINIHTGQQTCRHMHTEEITLPRPLDLELCIGHKSTP